MSRSLLPRRLAQLVLVVCLALLAAACGDDDPLADGDPTLGDDDPAADDDGTADDGADGMRMGHFDFPESQILAEVYAGALSAIGVEIIDVTPLAQREVTFPALENGDVDFLPEYNGNTLQFLVGDADAERAAELEEVLATFDSDEITAALRDELADRGLDVLEPSGAENRDALVVTGETADEHGLTTVSDLSAVDDEFVIAGPIEFAERETGLVGLEENYGLSFADFLATDACGPQTFAALADGEAQVARLCSTDAPIGENDWVILDEDIPFTFPNNITPIVRAAAVNDEIRNRIDEVSAALTTEVLQDFNSRFHTEGADAQQIAADFLAEAGLD